MSNSPAIRVRTIGLLALGVALGVAISLVVLTWFMPLKINQDSETVEWNDSNLSSAANFEQEVFSQPTVFYGLLLNADKDVALQMLERTHSIGSERLRNESQIAIIQRLTALDPIAALATIKELPRYRQNSLVSAVFGEWSLIDFDSAIEHAKTLTGAQKHASLRGILAHEDMSIDERNRISRQIGIKEFGGLESEATSTIVGTQHPEVVWQSLLDDELPDVSQTAEFIRLARQWVGQAGIIAINRIGQSLKDPIVQEAVVRSVLHRVTLEDPQLVLQHIAELKGEIGQLATRSIAEALVSINPVTGIESLAMVDSGSTRRQLLEEIVVEWAISDPEGILNQLDVIPQNMRTLGKYQAFLQLARVEPSTVAPMLHEVADEDFKFELAMELATVWAEQDLEAALEWATSDEFDDTLLRGTVLHFLLGKLALENPTLALQMALDRPVRQNSVGLEATVIAHVATYDLESAFEMLSQTRDGWSKTVSYMGVGRALLSNDETDRMLELATQLPADQQEGYYSSVFNQWANTKPLELAATIESLPTTLAKYHAAMELVRYNVGKNVLSKDQLNLVRTYLPDDYNAETGRRNSGWRGPLIITREMNEAMIEYRRIRSQTGVRF